LVSLNCHYQRLFNINNELSAEGQANSFLDNKASLRLQKSSIISQMIQVETHGLTPVVLCCFC